jgi:hypothetical protein
MFFMAESTTKMLWILRDNPWDMKHVQAESILNSSEKSGDKYLAKNEEGETYPQKKKFYRLTQHTLAKARKDGGIKRKRRPYFTALYDDWFPLHMFPSNCEFTKQYNKYEYFLPSGTHKSTPPPKSIVA